MLEKNNPDIDVDALMARVQHEVLRRQFGEPAAAAGTLGTIDTGALEGLISAASQRTSPRNRWPARLNFFPLNLKPLQRFCLRALAWLFRDQQAYNAALVQALREIVTVNVRLHALLRELDARIERLERRE
jgi:flagellar motility protein MotE (MotC chaperone)